MIFILSLGLSYTLINQFIKWDSPLERLNYRRVRVKNSGGIVIALTSLFISYSSLIVNFDNEILYFILAVATIAFVGLLDDVFGENGPKGLKGHFFYLGIFQITTGMVKAIMGLLLAAVTSILRGGIPIGIIVDILLITFSINLLNLFDLRPGRACKLFLVMWTLVMIYNFYRGQYHLIRIFAPVAAATIVFFRYDVGEILMLGDAGANILGLCSGLILAWSLPVKYKIPIMILVLLINLVAERYSLSLMIERTPILKFLDTIGRKSQWK